ncbi:CHASE3 domain-containing protein [Flavobacterium sp.]|jgi:signal transduction histidine kinase/CHASE3 domain sensor protein|uniref:sensor histidine kinase n=1 Tax=Flavobacterium sp. TaxID=239 RepID=UPI0037C00113
MFKYLQLYKSTVFLKVIFVLSIAIIFFIAAITFKHITVLKNSSIWLNKSYEVNTELERLISYIKDAETGQRGYLLSKDDTHLQPYYVSKDLVKVSFDKVSRLTKNSRTQQSNLKKLLYYINKKQNYLSKSLYLIKQNKTDELQIQKNLSEGKIVMDSIRSKIEDMIIAEQDLLDERQKDYEDTMAYTPIFIYLTLLITLFLITSAFLKMNNDLSALKKANNKLMVTNEANNLAEIVGNFGSWQLNIDNNTYIFSDNEYRLLGHLPQEFEASLEEFLKFVHPEDLEFVIEKTKNMSSNTNLAPFTYRIIRKDGQIRYFRGLGRVVENASGQKTFIGTTSDVTEEIYDKKIIEDRNRELETTNKELTAFNYIASHDLQEPLRKIETFISRLVDKDFNNISEAGQQYITRIQSSASRMRVLIDDLLQFSRTNKAEKVFEKIDLNGLLENAKQELAQLIEDKNAIIENTELPILNVIPFQIQQLFINLIGNSLKYGKENVIPQIKIESSLITAKDEELLPNTKDKFYKISVEDNGIGFEQEYANKIFILFNRLHNKNQFDGTGIGLAICKKIVENHKGYIFAEGHPNEGSTFTIYLPTT